MLSSRLRTTVVAAVVAFSAQSVAAQASPLIGTWNIEYERGRRVENDEVTPVMGKGVLTISMKGDSVVAILQAGPRPDGTPSPAATFSGVITAAGAVLVQKQQVRLNLNGEETTRDVTVTWTLKVTGNDLAGSLARDMPGAPMAMDPSPVKGTRAS